VTVTLAIGINVNCILLLDEAHGNDELLMTVNMTLPFIRSEALGVYTGFNIVSLLKVPLPLVCHWIPMLFSDVTVMKL